MEKKNKINVINREHFPKDILKSVIKGMKLPVEPSYWLVKLGARIYGGFDVEETSPREAMKKAKVPILFIHGEADDFVPCYMTQQGYDSCTGNKEKLFVESAGHGTSFLVDKVAYTQCVLSFLEKYLEDF